MSFFATTQLKKIDKEKKLDARPRKTFLFTFLSFPYQEVLNQRNKKSRGKGVTKNHPEKKSPPKKYFFKRTQVVSRVFELPLPRNAQKRTKKKLKKKKVRAYFFLRAGADARRFLVLFFRPPLGPWEERRRQKNGRGLS